MNQLGYYGKIPHRGDFVRFNLPQSFITVWDDWLRDVMVQGESRHTDWADSYTAAPAYRFVLSGGIAGNTPWMGVLIPSADKVGRRFPFCLAVSLAETSLPTQSLLNDHGWFNEAEQLLHKVCSSDYVFDELQAELAELARVHEQKPPSVDGLVTHTDHLIDEQFTICMTPAATSPAALSLAPMLDTVLQQTASEYSLWQSTDASQRLVLSTGLPTESTGIALMTQDWESAASTLIDLSVLPPDDTLLAPSVVDTRQNHEEGDSALDNTADVSPLPPPADPAADEIIPVSVQAEATTATLDSDKPAETVDTAPSADDWAALDDFGNDADFETLVVPQVEPLELDEDDLPDAPWEK